VKTLSGWDPSWECFVDGISIGATDPFPYFENNWPFCMKSDLNDGPHQLTVNVTSTTDHVFWLDSIAYVPSASVAEETAYIMVQNQDPAIAYGPGWTRLGDSANMTTTLGSELRFNFIGM
jgi:hypothetical protein